MNLFTEIISYHTTLILVLVCVHNADFICIQRQVRLSNDSNKKKFMDCCSTEFLSDSRRPLNSRRWRKAEHTAKIAKRALEKSQFAPGHVGDLKQESARCYKAF